ncbi:hypothetical protein Acr_22g0003650 [Actinidia rufa]|uniref:Uncharacterized protein n=1 Tax=Actinidia rufa TaxID=165716 RepID=A0A7J0GJH8_9ERIC|nr:hypothetical protein Acr_22g0003650 [Actinidia rufa]
MTLHISNAHLRVAHPPPQLEPHVVELNPLDDEIPPLAATDIPSTSTAPSPVAFATSDSKVADSIAALFAHMDVIHKDLVEHI